MNERFTIRSTPLKGLVTLTRHPRCDARGEFERLFCEQELAAVLPAGRRVVQINRSLTAAPGFIRGMHFQHPPHAETKIVSCVLGKVFDVAVDVRPGSPTRYQWHGVVLSADDHTSLVIPEGFAHGFQTLTANCELLYFHTEAWSADAEAGLHSLDPALAIQWPLPVAGMSDRDCNHPFISVNKPRATLEAAA